MTHVYGAVSQRGSKVWNDDSNINLDNLGSATIR
jgi:hypothetical protein